MHSIVHIVFHLAVLAAIALAKNQQSWSHHTYNGESYTLKCESDKYTLTPQHVISWSRHGRSGILRNDDHYELKAASGVNNAELVFKKVSDEQHGIYLCHIRDWNGNLQDSVVLGLNVGVRQYHDEIDKYQDQIIVGVIAAGSTFVLLMAVGLVSNFRYLSEESLEKRRHRKAQRLDRERNGFKNHAYASEMTEANPQTNGSSVMDSSYNVHL